MRTISTTKIPTATHVLNCVKGCPNCENGLCKSGGFQCWAAAMCKRFARPWAKSEVEYVKTNMDNRDDLLTLLPKVPRKLKEWWDGFWQEYQDRYVDAFGRFQMFWLHGEFEKTFPVKPSRIAALWMTDVGLCHRQWVLKVIDKIKADNEAREKKGLKLHTFQFLTKFPEVYSKYGWPKNCWLGFTATKQTEFNGRYHDILPSSIDRSHPFDISGTNPTIYAYLEPIIDFIDISKSQSLNWIIVGGQGLGSKKAINPEWVRMIRDDCIKLDIKFCFKGWGKKIPPGQKKGKLDGVAWQQFPEVEDV